MDLFNQETSINLLPYDGQAHYYGKILSAAEKKCKMSRATFDKHLKQLQKDSYVKRSKNNKLI